MLLDMHVQAVRPKSRQIRSSSRLSGDGEGNEVPKFPILHCQEKPLARKKVPVPQTDTGGWDENSKTRGRTLVKELGKMTP